jgi:hypothetical protein
MADCPSMRRALALLLALFTMTAEPAPADPRAPSRVFFSGHSLTDLPMPQYFGEVARSLGTPVTWDRQYMVGSAIKYRARGRGAETGWAGYSMGLNREGEGLNVIEELRLHPYDALVITEQHGVLDSLVWHDTVRYLRHYHERFIAGNPRGRTVFYEPWLGIPGKSDDPRRWIAYERAASPVWQCIVTRVNTSLEAEGRGDRIESLPAGVALVELVERATQGDGVDGVTAPTARATLDRIFHDQVHLAPMGHYYIALVTYAGVFGRSPAGAWAPDGVSAAQAASLQRVAWEALQRWRAENRALTLAQCRDYINGPFQDLYFDHMRDDYWAGLPGSSLVNTLKRIKHTARTRWKLKNDADPFAFDAATDPQHWLPAPSP